MWLPFFVLIPLIKYLRAPGQPSVQSPQRPSITVSLAWTCVAHHTAPSAAWVEVHLSYFTPSYTKGNTHGSESAPKVPQEAVNYKNPTFSFHQIESYKERFFVNLLYQCLLTAKKWFKIDKIDLKFGRYLFFFNLHTTILFVSLIQANKTCHKKGYK